MIASKKYALTVFVILFGGLAAFADGYGDYYGGYCYPSYEPTVTYAAPVVVAAPAFVSPAACPPQVSIYAQPTSAPASQAPASSPPKVTKSRANYTAYSSPGDRAFRAAASTCRVGFWNVSARSIALSVDGQTYALPAGRSMTLTVHRQFTWFQDGGKMHLESVPQGQTAMEIVIRR